jgi:hypothetical protein
MKRAEHIYYMGEKINAYKIIRKPEGGRQLTIPTFRSFRCEDNIRLTLQKL